MRSEWRTPDIDTYDGDYLTETEQRLADTLPPVKQGGRRTQEPEPEIVTLADVMHEGS